MTTAVETEAPKGFRRLKLQPKLLAALDRANYRKPSPIQAALIPYVLAGRDAIGQAQTGTGKTAAFLIPFFNAWKQTEGNGPQALVLAPTRELVVQICEEAKKLSPSKKLRMLAVYGGQPFRQQAKALESGCDLVVGTPGRILDHLGRNTLSFDGVTYAVLDEADRMLDIGFRDDIRDILSQCPTKRQTLLMSATMPDSVLELAGRYQTKPVHIKVRPKQVTVDKIKQVYISVDHERKFDLLLRVLEREKPKQCIIFTERKRWADRLSKQLKDHYPDSAAMHGDLPQPKRNKIMKRFREGKVSLLVATDVVGRGIDVRGISHIINYDLPKDPEAYVHRIGRTGRMGADGIAIAFVTAEEGKELTAIEGYVNRLIEKDTVEGFEAVAQKPEKAQPEDDGENGRGKKYSWRVV